MITRRTCVHCGHTYRVLYRAQVCPCQLVIGERAPLDIEIARFWEQWGKNRNDKHSKGIR